jgi:polyhydroxybutyrate depolymerase
MSRRAAAAVVAFAALWVAVPAAHACSLASTGGTTTRILAGRTYQLHVPAGLTGPTAPLLVTMHGLSSFGRAHEADTGWSPFADAHGFIVAYPDGVANAWDFQQGSYDVTFLRNVVADIAATWCVDPTRVYASGHSNGAYMAQRLACDAPDLFASVTEYAGGSPETFGSPCTPSRGVAVGLFQGDADMVVQPAWGQRARDEWVARDACAPTAASEPVSEGVLQRWSGCRDGAEVIWRTYPGQSHLWPQGARGDDIRSRMWTFLGAHPRP